MGKIIEFIQAVRFVLRHGPDAVFRDPLTGLYNRRFLPAIWAREIASARRHWRPLSAALLDLDGLKHINDTLGHLAGDQVLRRIAKAIRGSDVAVRWGGDEFLVLFPDTDAPGAELALKRIATAAGSDVRFSFGIAAWCRDVSLEELVKEADRALYEQKQQRGAGSPSA